MRILIVHNQLWAHYKATVFSELHRITSETEHQIHVIQIAEVEKSRQNMGGADRSVHQYSYEILFDGALEDVALLPKIAKLLERTIAFAPDVVNVTGYYDSATWALLLYCKLRGIPVILSNESTAQDHHRGGFKERFKSWLVRQYDGFFCFGTMAASYMIELGANPEKILSKNAAVVDNQTIENRFKVAKSNRTTQKKELGLPPNNFVFVGRLVEVKNLPFLLRVFKKVSVQAQDWGLILVGDGTLVDMLQHQVKEQQINNIYFAGSQPWQHIPDWLALADAFIITSTSETWGLVVNEAMICELPVLVSTQCGCAVDLVNEGQNGFTFDPSNENELVELMLRFTSKSVDLPLMGAQSKQLIKKFSPKEAAKAMLQGFELIVLQSNEK